MSEVCRRIYSLI